jgi:hypothetical protein
MEPATTVELLKVVYWYIREAEQTGGPPSFESVQTLVTNLHDWMSRPTGNSRSLGRLLLQVEEDGNLRKAEQ